LDEATLIRRSQDGNLAAFNTLVDTYQHLAFNVAYRLLADRETAADVTQDAFISAYEHIRSFRGGSFKAWLLRIVTNACHDHHRRRQRRPSTSLDQLMETPVADALIDGAESPDDGVVRIELQDYIQRGLLTLPLEQRVAVVLSDIQGFSYDEIADATNSTLGTVKSRLARGRGRLRDFLLAQQELLPTQFRP
jgi:RNA polymerase sigma-70 factor, ECF subfamily